MSSSSNDEEEEEEGTLVLLMMATGVSLLHLHAQQLLLHRNPQTPRNNSKLRGIDWLDERLAGHEGKFYGLFGMSKYVFGMLLEELKDGGLLSDSKGIRASEQLAIFVTFVRHASTTTQLEDTFQRSPDTIHRYIYKVLNALLDPAMYSKYIKMPDATTPLAPEIHNNPRRFPFFKDAVGAIDGTQIAVGGVAADKQDAWRNRKGFLSQNVLAASSFDLKFQYIFSGFEGSAHDAKVLGAAPSFRVPEGKYYLADAGYALTNKVLVPFRGVRYHLKEWSQQRDAPQTEKELYNLRHSSLRNVVERIFGVAKRRFKILRRGSEHPLETQARIVPAVCLLHNFIRIHSPDDNGENLPELEEVEHGEDDVPASRGVGGEASRAETRAAEARRAQIASEMWDSYQAYRRRRGNRVALQDEMEDVQE